MITPSLEDVLGAAMSQALDGVHTAFPGRVESYDAATQKVSVKPLVRRAYRDEVGDRQLESLPVIPGVPVVFPGAGAYSITFPIAAGDTVLVVVASVSLDRWLVGRGGEVDAALDNRHSLEDAIAIPGLRAFGAPVANAGAGGEAMVLAGAEVRLGSATAARIVAALDELADVVAKYNVHTHASFSAPPVPLATVPTGSPSVKVP